MLDSGILIRSYQAKVKDMGKEKRGKRTASGAANVEAFELCVDAVIPPLVSAGRCRSSRLSDCVRDLKAVFNIVDERD